MAWPTAQDYSEAVQNPRLNFQDAELKTGQVELTPLGLPRPRSGNFATVYRMRCGQRHWAVRCFLRNVTDQQERYAEISDYLARIKRLGRIQLPYMVNFEFLEEGIKVNGQWYPILKMEWVEGELLDKFIEKHLPNSTTLRGLAERWVTMTQTLESAGIAHGDLQHGNILIVKGKLKLIDYDGMFVPTLCGFSSNEVGHYNYQPPSRTGNDFRADIDRFSAWVIYIALISLSIDPSLWQRVGAGDEFILLRKEDFVKPDTSATLRRLTQHNDALIHSLITEFKQLLRNPAQIPPLEPQKVIVSTTPRPVSNANQGTTTHTTSTSSDWLTDYLPQLQQVSSSNRYTDNGDGTVTDNRSGLIWLKNANCFGGQNWKTANRSAAKLAHGQCGLCDGSKAGMWRLPTKDEWEAMMDEKYVNSDWNQPAISNAAGTGPWKEGDAFSGVQADYYWSSTESARYSGSAWYVNLGYGCVDGYDKACTYYVWAVRRRQ